MTLERYNTQIIYITDDWLYEEHNSNGILTFYSILDNNTIDNLDKPHFRIIRYKGIQYLFLKSANSFAWFEKWDKKL